MSPYQLDSKFEMSSLAKLEGTTHINIVSTLLGVQKELVDTIKVKLNSKAEQRVQGVQNQEKVYLELIIDHWVAGKSKEVATWEALIGVLRELDLRDMSIDIEDFMYGEFFSVYIKIIKVSQSKVLLKIIHPGLLFREPGT